MKTFALLASMLLPCLLFGSAFTSIKPSTAPAPTLERDRSPIDLALSADGHYALTANATSDTVSLVDVTAGTLLSETQVGKRPFAVALSTDGKRAVVSNQYSDSISVLEVGPSQMHVVRTIPVGDEPRGVALSKDGATAYVALSGEDQLAFVDVEAGKVTAKLPVGVEPWHVAVTPDGTRLAVGNSRSHDVSVVDIAAQKVAYTVRLRGTNVRHIAISPDGQWAYMPHTSERGRPTTQQFIGLGWVVGNRLSRCPLKAEGPREAIALDKQGDAVGDVDGAAISPDGNTVALTAGGTHELLLLRLPLPFIAYGGPGDTVEKELLNNDRYRRIRLDGRPMGLVYAPDGKTITVANYLSNSVQVVDVASGQVTRTIALGGPASPSLARQGEALFLDATRSFHHWYSCNSCHVEGHTNGSNFDTYNDGSYNTPKKTLSLRGVTQTGPWTWHGWQKDLRQLIHASMVKTMEGPEPTDAELDAMYAYLQTIDFKPNPHRNLDGSLTAEAKHGEAVFNASGCNTCHAPPNYTTPAVYVVGLETPLDFYKGFNPPSLRGVYNRSPYLQMGQATTLREVLTKYHQASKLTNKPDPTGQDLDDLIAFLRSL